MVNWWKKQRWLATGNILNVYKKNYRICRFLPKFEKFGWFYNVAMRQARLIMLGIVVLNCYIPLAVIIVHDVESTIWLTVLSAVTRQSYFYNNFYLEFFLIWSDRLILFYNMYMIISYKVESPKNIGGNNFHQRF
jgi:hypothetical protein